MKTSSLGIKIGGCLHVYKRTCQWPWRDVILDFSIVVGFSLIDVVVQ